MTLSIGDGANDVNMITEAHVGIGIKGLEGQQAARASDFSIGEFKMLRRLMFFHGRECYRKNSTLILYNFYKNVLLCMPQLWFGWSNWLSGQTLYEAINYQMYNIFYAFAPIVLYAIIDRQTSDYILMHDPIYYAPGPKRMLFNMKRFLIWFGWASFQGLCLVMLAYFYFDEGFSSMEGHNFGFWALGQTTFIGVVILANVKILTFSNAISIMQMCLVEGSILLAFLAWIWVSRFELSVLHASFQKYCAIIQEFSSK